MVSVVLYADAQRSHARTRGGLGTEFFPPSRSEVRKKKRTIYRKTAMKF